ncbi:hypothetical protein J1614_001923 [Plenodomus biglobosus]|nr:hypothetical protein J1614_001923 [Plenodomus biglobosus]
MPCPLPTAHCPLPVFPGRDSGRGGRWRYCTGLRDGVWLAMQGSAKPNVRAALSAYSLADVHS